MFVDADDEAMYGFEDEGALDDDEGVDASEVKSSTKKLRRSTSAGETVITSSAPKKSFEISFSAVRKGDRHSVLT